MQAEAAARRIAIVGGGAAGTIVACELATIDSGADVDLFEPSGDVGPGLAYSTADPLHVVNVPAAKLSAIAAEPDHFVSWLAARGEDARAEAYPARRTYGEYLRELFASRRAVAERTTIRVVPRAATAAELVDNTRYDAVVLALGNLQAPPPIALPDDARCFWSPWQTGALEADGLPHRARVLVVGTGLTAVDAVLSVAAAAPGAALHMVSRNGELPFAHLPGPLRAPAPHGDMPTACTTMEELAAAWERHMACAQSQGYDWRDVVDGIRPITQQLWQALAPAEQARFLRECRRRWERRRNRAAPEVGARLEDLRSTGRLQLRVGDAHTLLDQPWDRIIAATGPTADIRRTTNSLAQELLDRGIAAPDAHCLGIRTTGDGRVVGPDDRPSDRLWTLGWLRRGELWESLAIPEIRTQARAIAEQLSDP